MKKLFALMSIVALTLAFASCSNKNSSPEAVVNAYMSAIQKGDAEKAIDLMYFENELDDEKRTEFVNMFNDKLKTVQNDFGGVASFEIGEVKMDEDGEHAVVKCKTVYGNGEDEDGKQKTIKVNGKWYIDSGK